MACRRIARTVGAAAGGLLGVAFLPSAVALADGDYGDYTLTGSSPLIVSDGGVRDFFVSVPPAAEGTVQGTQTFDVNGDPQSTIGALVGNNTDLYGNTNQVLLVTGGSGDVPGIHSVFDTYTYTSGISTVYSDVVESDGTHDITYTWETPWGNLNIPTTFDAAGIVPVDQTEGLPEGDGYSYLLSGPESYYGVSAITPAATDIQGYQNFIVDNGGTPVGNFSADVTNTADYLNNSTQAFLVTSSSGDAPAVGSVYNTFFFGHGIENIYSAIPQADGTDKLTDTLVTPFGTFNIPETFDAAKGLADVLNGTAPLGQEIATNSFDITPTADPATITAMDGLPPEDVVIQGTQAFNYDDLTSGNNDGTFLANVTQSAIVFGNTTQDQYVVTQDLTGNAPAVNSFFEVDNYGHGYELVYSDLVGAGSGGDNLITETWVTPFGDFNVPTTYDASAVYLGDTSQNFPGNGSMLSELFHTFDPSAAASAAPASALDTGSLAEMFPHLATALDGGSLADMFPNLATAFDAGSLADVFPHLDAALNLLTGLF
jgi:hypothetical protein